MIQDYLNANLLTITDDGDFKKLKKSSDEIAKKLLKNRAKIVSYTLAAIDPDISANNDDILEVKDNIIKNWSTFTANSKDTPLTFIRAVMLEALDIISEDVNIAVLIWYSSRNIIKYYSIVGQEREIIFEFLSKLGNKINQEANDTWVIINKTVTKTNIDLKEISRYAINDDTLQKYLEDASGPTNEKGVKNFESPNPHWPNANDTWSYQFAPRAAKGIKIAIDPSLKAIVTVVNENQKIIQTGINNSLEKLEKELSERSKSLQLRSELLWWKESCYSASTDKSYKELEDGIISIVTAIDYSSFIPVIYPKSVDYFLKEMFQSIKNDTNEQIEIEKLIELINSNSEQLLQVLPEINTEAEKISLLTFIIGLIKGKYDLKQFESLLGFQADVKLSTIDFTLWLFHDFQLLKALNTK
jgi:hypothetical protein